MVALEKAEDSVGDEATDEIRIVTEDGIEGVELLVKAVDGGTFVLTSFVALLVCDENVRLVSRGPEGTAVRDPMIIVEDASESILLLFKRTGNGAWLWESKLPPPVPVMICAAIKSGCERKKASTLRPYSSLMATERSKYGKGRSKLWHFLTSHSTPSFM